MVLTWGYWPGEILQQATLETCELFVLRHGSTECSGRVGYSPFRAQLTGIPSGRKLIPFAVDRSKHFATSCDRLSVLDQRRVGGIWW
jgi:hypothetical protein